MEALIGTAGMAAGRCTGAAHLVADCPLACRMPAHELPSFPAAAVQNNFCCRHKNGFGFADCNPKFIWSGLHIFTDHYPE